MFKRLFPDLKPLTKYIAQGPKNQFPKTLYQMQIHSWGISCTKASSFSFQGWLARKLCFHFFGFQFLRDASHEASFSHLQLSAFEGRLALKLCFLKLMLQFGCNQFSALVRAGFSRFSALAPRSGFGAGLGQEKTSVLPTYLFLSSTSATSFKNAFFLLA